MSLFCSFSFDSDLWKDVPSCKQINFTSCNVTFIKAEAEHGCVMLGVQAESRGLTSDLVRACTTQGKHVARTKIKAHLPFIEV